MKTPRVVASHTFNSQLFERFSLGEEERRSGLDTYAIDGGAVLKEEWNLKLDAAIAADITRLKRAD